MRLVVLLCGVIAGIVGLGFAWWGEPGALVDIYRLPTASFAAAVLAIHAVSVNSIAGGLMVLGSPRIGGMMMLASATIWLLLIALLGSGLGVSMAALIGIGGGGGILAFLPSLSRAAYRLERARDEAPRVIASGRPDIVAEVRTRVEEQPATYNWRSTVSETAEDHSKPFDPSQWRFDEPPQPQAGKPSEASQWRFENPDAPPAEEKRATPPPPRREPPREPPEREQLREALREPPRAANEQPWISREDRKGRAAYEIHHGRIQPLTLKGARKKRTRGRTATGLVALGLLVVGLPTLLVVDHQMRLGADDAVASPAAATAAEATGNEVPVAAAAPVQPRLEAGNLPSFNEASPAAEAVALPSAKTTVDAPMLPMLPMPAPVLSQATAEYKTPFDYCAGNRTSDTPETGKIGEGLPPELVEGVREVANIPNGEVMWRCMTKDVWVCAQPPGGLTCGKVPTPAERKDYCAAHPGATGIVAAAGTWRCNGKIPFVPGGDQRTTDPRGFDRLVWLRLPAPA